MPDRLVVWLRAVAVPGVWPGLSIIGIVLATLLASWLTGQVWVAAMVGVAGMVLAAWPSVKMLAVARDALDRTERARAAMEQALRRSQKMEALGRLTVGAAHDFNNHLTVISSNVEMVANRLDGTQQRLLRHTEAALQAVQRAAALTGLLLSFSRQPVPEPEAVPVDRLLIGVSDLLRRALGDRIGLDVVSSDVSWFTWADVTQMENALLSLAINARDRGPDGAKLIIAVSNIHLDAVFEAAYPSVPPGDYVQIAVGGAPEADEPQAWLPADDLSSAYLSVARAFVQEANGFLLRPAAAAGGLSLRLVLPRCVPPTTTISHHDAGGRTTILVVEDDAAVRSSCVKMLRKLDYDVLEAPDAMEAFRLIADHGGIDLLFTDIGLPGGVSGRALAEAARDVDAGIKVLFTTGYEQVDPPLRAATALLRKPFSAAQLAAMVRDVLAAERPVVGSETAQN
ncbi:response regulator [Acidisphaera sp. S103]|uniref:response regulator n=1 Tax=Acidisphaera sp. S103 TaxID=1747223 RepID=UPI00131EC29A|nr:response regulator [Acidisphaera sp. S103]